jgi:hypothetical protein
VTCARGRSLQPHASNTVPMQGRAHPRLRQPLLCCLLFLLCYLDLSCAGGGPGTLVAEVELTGGRIVGSPATPINLPGRTSRSGSTSSELGETQSCADITTGLFLSTLLVTPNRTLSNSAQQVKACSSGKQQVSLMLGPFTEESCGSYTVRSS